jgi:hypothetical protein
MWIRLAANLALTAALAIMMAAGCAYPRRTTPLTPVTGQPDSLNQPDDVWQLTILGAQVPPRQRSGLAWDGEDGGPDPFVRLYRAGELVWESDPVEDTLKPEFEQTLATNVWLPDDRKLRFELWDADRLGKDPIGVWRGRGLPESALPGAEARLLTDSRANLVFRIDPPKRYRGSGIRRYEVRSSTLRVLEVIERSPAGRAGIDKNSKITSIEGRSISELGEKRAASSLAQLGTKNGGTLTVQHPEGQRERVRLDGGYVWPVM